MIIWAITKSGVELIKTSKNIIEKYNETENTEDESQ